MRTKTDIIVENNNLKNEIIDLEIKQTKHIEKIKNLEERLKKYTSGDRHRRYYENHSEKIKSKVKIYREQNREKFREYNREYMRRKREENKQENN